MEPLEPPLDPPLVTLCIPNQCPMVASIFCLLYVFLL